MNPAQLSRRHVMAGAFASGWAGRVSGPTAVQPRTTPAEGDYIDWDSVTVEFNDHELFRGEFRGWLGMAHDRFSRPVALVENTPSTTTLHVPGLHPALTIDLVDVGDINVHVTWSDVCWDILASFDVMAEAVDGIGWRNILFVPDAQVPRVSREACWTVDGFEPLLQWFNEQLVPATHLALCGSEDGGWTAARLVQDGGFHPLWKPIDGCRHIRHLLPLHASA